MENLRATWVRYGLEKIEKRQTEQGFFADRWIFEPVFPPVTARKICLLVHEATWGGGAARIVPGAGGQTGPHRITRRDVGIYGPR